jgi:hypothetical protein
LALEERLTRKELECEEYLKQASRAASDQKVVRLSEEERDDLQLEYQDNIMNLQRLVDDHKLRTVEVSGTILLPAEKSFFLSMFRPTRLD